MIAGVRGPVLEAGLDRVVVEVGGVGVLVHTTPATAAGLRAGQEATLSTSLVVREESLTLYGFADAGERDLFEQVQTVSGVGPRLALAMLSVHDPDALRAAIGDGDLTALTKIPGIGRKGAERIVLELRDKIAPPQASSAAAPETGSGGGRHEEVQEALVGLGWSAKQADDALAAVADQGADDVSALLRLALRELGR